MKKKSLRGYYLKQNVSKNGVPYYVKQKPTQLYLSRTDNGRWTISHYVKNFMYQDSKGDPAPLDEFPWTIKIGTDFVETPGIVLTPRNEDTKEKNNHQVLIICISVAIIVIVMGLVFVVFLRTRRSKINEEPTMEKNVYYGCDDEDYYTEHDDRVEDINDYYE